MATRMAPFGDYTNAEAIPGPLKAELTANLNILKNFLPVPGAINSGVPTPHADFDRIQPATSAKLRAEIDAIIAAVAAAA